MGVKVIEPGALRPVTLRPPPSKSDAQRALVLAHLLGREAGPLAEAQGGAALPDDVRVVQRGLGAIARSAQTGAPEPIDCGDGGAPFRLLLSQAAITPGSRVEISGSTRLGERPHRALVEALTRTLGPAGLKLALGAPWPVRVEGAQGAAPDPTFRVEMRESSQFASSLLLAACGLHLREGRGWTVEQVGAGGSAGYLELTVRWVERCGFEVTRAAGRIVVSGHTAPAAWPRVPGDWSSLGYLLLLAWASGGAVAGADLEAAHPDRAVVRLLREVGLTVTERGPGELGVGGVAAGGVRATAAECPDLLPTLAALGCVCPAPSVLEEVHLLRGKESDRLEGIRALVDAAGGRTELEGNTLTLFPPERVRPFSFHSRGDHRLAMSAAVLAVLGRVPLTLAEPECVSKSFPGFFEELSSLGVRLG